ncbi:MAG: phosphomannomutase CpsG [Colwellia sp.]|nr:phosphomannomutase CpsG [Colwellia sp.]
MQTLNCFKAYDIRGEVGKELNTDIAARIGKAMALFLQAKLIVVGGDCRLSTPELKQAVIEGIRSVNCDVVDIGVCGTEEIYFATRFLEASGGIVITASHNPKNYNGMKLVREDSKPISSDSGLNEIKALAEKMNCQNLTLGGNLFYLSTVAPYIDHILEFIKVKKLKPLKLVVNAGNGVAGHIIDIIQKRFWKQKIPIEFYKIYHEANGEFPNGVPNPLLPENREVTKQAVLLHKADLGIAWDGDFDRCFLFDENGEFIEGYYIVGLLAEFFLKQYPSEKIIHDPRLIWNTVDIVTKNGGTAIETKTGHAFIKERMRKENAIYGGEMSAHHYFRDFGYCDSGMIPWLLIIELISRSNQPLSTYVNQQMKSFPSSGEINRNVSDPDMLIDKVNKYYQHSALSINNIDGLSMSFEHWRFNLRKSNTESLLRLNVETKGCKELLANKVKEILSIVD